MRSCLLLILALFQIFGVLSQLPPQFDSRQAFPTCLPDIQNEGECGSAAIYSSTDVLSVSFCTGGGGGSPELDYQYIESCGNFGCSGTEPQDVWNFLETNGTLAGVCATDPPTACPGIKCKSQETDNCCYNGAPKMMKAKSIVPLNSPLIIQQAIYQWGAVYAGVDASSAAFEMYTSGVLSCNGSYQLDHSVYLLGWGVSGQQKYWIAANSWGSGWGMNGYFYIGRGSNTCGIEAQVVAILPAMYDTCSLSCTDAEWNCLGGACNNCAGGEGGECLGPTKRANQEILIS